MAKLGFWDAVKSALDGTAEWASEELKEARLKTCQECSYFKKMLKICGVCGCYMPAKVAYQASECPEGKW